MLLLSRYFSFLPQHTKLHIKPDWPLSIVLCCARVRARMAVCHAMQLQPRPEDGWDGLQPSSLLRGRVRDKWRQSRNEWESIIRCHGSEETDPLIRGRQKRQSNNNASTLSWKMVCTWKYVEVMYKYINAYCVYTKEKDLKMN